MKYYVHYGDAHYDPSKFRMIRNGAGMAHNKPWGGLWGSPVNSRYGWKQFVEDEGIVPLSKLKEENSFTFALRDGAKVLTIRRGEDCIFPMVEMMSLLDGERYMAVDFVKLSTEYDAVEVEIEDVYNRMSGWDCDSIVILNPAVVVETRKEV